MKRSLPPFLIVAILLAAPPVLSAQEAPSSEQPAEVTKLDGTKLFGVVEITDDYTIRVRGESGIQNIPLALLGESDFRKYGQQKDRSQDGRLWSERQDALEQEKENNPKNAAAIEFRLGELAPFQPLISTYKTLNPSQPGDSQPTPASPAPSPSFEKSSTLHMFSGPGSLNVPTVPFASGAADTVLSPAASAASSASALSPVGIPVP